MWPQTGSRIDPYRRIRPDWPDLAVTETGTVLFTDPGIWQMRLLRTRSVASFLLFAMVWGCGTDDDNLDPDRFPIIPIPADFDGGRGEFVLNPETGIVLSHPGDPELRGVVDRWASELRELSGFQLPILDAEDAGGRNLIRIEVTSLPKNAPTEVAAGMGLPGIAAEGYELEVRSRGIELEAPAKAGIFYGLQTLSQLIPGPESPSPWAIPAVEIEDAPRFAYRGMHLDVGRHFFPVSFLKEYIDLLATYKMNVFHWHLTEDQGWRLEIQGYPRLTEVGSCRAETIVEKNFDPFVGDGMEYCGFYTQDEAREIVEYARERFIMVMPEIELPGHSVAALAAYPELACTPGPFEVSTRWGVTRDIYCPKEETFAFLEDVLTEVMEIFPSPYIHIGGDEAPKTAWEESELAQEVIRREGLADEEELQSWFIRRIEGFLNANGRRLMGWDEILEGGLAPDATVMSWRGETGGIQAAREGHDVVMTPNSHVYLDHYQGDTLQEPLAIGGYSPLERVYAYEPVPAELSPIEARHVLGAQGNVWTEYIETTEYLEYMAFPRALALSEVVWSPSSERDWEGFTDRLPSHMTRLEAEGVNFRIPDVLGLEADRLSLEDSVLVELSGAVSGGEVRYALHGTDPSRNSPLYEGPFMIPVDEDGTEVAARLYLRSGREGALRRARFSRTHLMPPTSVPWIGRDQGLVARGFSGRFRSVDDLEGGQSFDVSNISPGAPSSLPRVTVPDRVPAGSFGLTLTGFIRVPRKGIYTFYLSSDDGSRLTVGDRVVVNHDGPHSMAERAGQVALHRGWHPIEVRYFQSGGGYGLQLEVEGPGVSRREVPATWLAHSQDPTD
jgi:hexosaminidase